MRTLATILVLAILALPVGCGSSQKAGDSQKALAEYNAGRYAEAESEALAAMNRSTGPAKEDAAYIAGLSAYRLGKLGDAERRFMLAAQSADEHTSGSAKAMLGEIRLDQRRPREAAVYFADASRLLDGQDASQAARRAALAHQQSGDASASQQWMTIANGPAQTPGHSTTSSTARPNVGFALQVGAFQDKSRAQRAASEAESLARKDGLGPVRVIPKRDDRGKPLYLVQFGFFTSRDAASAARTRLGRLEYIVTPVS